MLFGCQEIKMKKILLDAEGIHNEKQAHEYFKAAFGMDRESEFSLDALYGTIMSIKENTQIVFPNAGLLVDELGRYGLGIISLFRDASHESKYITFKW